MTLFFGLRLSIKVCIIQKSIKCIWALNERNEGSECEQNFHKILGDSLKAVGNNDMQQDKSNYFDMSSKTKQKKSIGFSICRIGFVLKSKYLFYV